MSTHKKISNLKFISFVFFVIAFFVSGFISNVNIVSAATDSKAASNPPFTSYKTIIFIENGISTTTVVIGCGAGTGDIYDMNTGKKCTNNTAKPAVIGCAAGSGDIYDMNTGKKCTNNTKPVIVGCAKDSGDIYDMNTGKPCSEIMASSATVSVLARNVNTADTLSKNTTKISSSFSKNTISTEEEGESLLATTDTDEDSLSGREKIGKSLAASAGKIGSMFKGPMFIWVILIIIILLGGGYGIFNMAKKSEEEDVVPAPVVKAEVKTNPTITTAQPTTPAHQAAPVSATPVQTNQPNTNPQVK